MIEITDAALAEMQHLLDDEPGDEPKSMRLFVKGGGCAGMAYGMEVTHEAKTEDKVVETPSFTVLIDPKSFLFLKGTIVDYKKGMMGQGFVFENPNATGSCGCGTSFSID